MKKLCAPNRNSPNVRAHPPPIGSVAQLNEPLGTLDGALQIELDERDRYLFRERSASLDSHARRFGLPARASYSVGRRRRHTPASSVGSCKR